MTEAFVALRLRDAPDASLLKSLRAAGATVPLRADGSPRGRGRTIAARLAPSSVARVASLAGVVELEFVGAPFGAPPPLDGTVREIDGHDTWRVRDDQARPFAGAGVTLCAVDSGVDVFHPMFFRADGGAWPWRDEDQSGDFTPGTDTVDVTGDGA
ncbi:MAG: hypothetical protein JRI23_08770, partial [Deltaproteobacteria bacterium]|nr:hypothetical protein [Deltaproteobacteria bacterium]